MADQSIGATAYITRRGQLKAQLTTFQPSDIFEKRGR